MKLLTTKEVAAKLGVSDAHVRHLIISGKLPAQKLGHIHAIAEADLEKVKNRKRGRPPRAKKAAE